MDETELTRSSLGHMTECALAVIETYRSHGKLTSREQDAYERQTRIARLGMETLLKIGYAREEAVRHGNSRVARAIDKLSPLEQLAAAGSDPRRVV